MCLYMWRLLSDAMMWGFISLVLVLAAVVAPSVSAAALGCYNADPPSVSVSGLSAGGFMTVQLGVAYSNTFQKGLVSLQPVPMTALDNNP